MRIGSAAALLVAVAMALPATAHQAGSRQTREFVQAAGESDAFEIMSAQTALAESHDPQVIAFARQMIADHGRTSQALLDATAQAHVAPPTIAVGAGQAPFLASLQSLRGVEFDRGYWRQQALAHRAALTTEQAYAASGDTPSIRQAAVAAVPIIQAHLAMADQMSAAAQGR